MPGDMGTISFENVSDHPPSVSPAHVCTHNLMQDAVLDFVPIPEKQTKNPQRWARLPPCREKDVSFGLQVWD